MPAKMILPRGRPKAPDISLVRMVPEAPTSVPLIMEKIRARMPTGRLVALMSTVLAEIDRGDGRPWTAPPIGGVAVMVTPVDAVGLGGAGGGAGRPVDQEGVEARRARPRHPLHGPHHARGRRHAGQGHGAVRQGGAARPARPVDPVGRRSVRLPRPGAGGGGAPAGQHRQGRQRGRRLPGGLSPLDVRLDEIRRAVADGADEIDIVLNRSAFLAGRLPRGLRRDRGVEGGVRRRAPQGHPRDRRARQLRRRARASMLAMAAGADVIKTSTGKIGTAATLPVALCMAEAIRDFADQTGRVVGLKLAGGMRTAKQSWQYLVIVSETLGPDWLDPDRFRIGASTLLNDVLMQIAVPAHRPLPATRRLHDRLMTMTTSARHRGRRRTPVSTESVGHARLRDRRASRRRSSTSRTATNCSSTASSSSPLAAGRSPRSTRPPRSRWPRWPRPAPPTSTPPSPRPAGPTRTAGASCRARSGPSTCTASPACCRSEPRVRRARDARRRQADQGVARRRRAARRRPLLLLRGLGRQARLRLPRPRGRVRSASPAR